MIDYLFFDSNRLLEGKRLEKGKRLKFETAVFFAKQLVNAGFYYKQIGLMPDSLLPENLFVTEDNFLFVNEKTIDYKDFEESKYLSKIKEFFYSLIFGDENFEGKSLQPYLKNYSQKFTNSIDNIAQQGNSLVNLLFVIDEIQPVKVDKVDRFAHFRIGTSFFENVFKSTQNTVFWIFPFSHIVSPFLYFLGGDYSGLEIRESVPFGSYNRFAEKFFYLNLPQYSPEKLADVDLMWKRVKPLLKNIGEDIAYFELGENIDSFSLEIFEKISEEIKNFKVIVFEKKPFAKAYNKLLKKGKAAIFNPPLSGEIGIINYIYPEYSFQQFLSRLNRESEKLFIPFLYLLEKGYFSKREEVLDSLGLDKKELENLRKLKPDLILQKKGFFEKNVCKFPLERKPVTDKEIENIILKAEKGNLKSLIESKDFLKKNKSKIDLAEYVENRKNFSNSVKGFFWYCADNFKKALSFWDKEREKILYPYIVESLFFLNKFDALIDFCEQNNFFSSFYNLVVALKGKDVKGVKVDGYCALEFAYRKRDFESLKRILQQIKKKDATYYRFKAIVAYFEAQKDFKTHFDKAIEFAQSENNFLELALIYKHYGNAMYYTEDFFRARDYYLKALKIAVDIDNEGIFEDVEYNLAHIDVSMCELDRSYRYFLKLYLREKNTDHYREQIYLLKALAKINAFASRGKEAEKYLLKALEIAEIHGLKSELPQIHFVLTTVYQDLRDFEKSEYYLSLFEKESNIELYKREITYKKIELCYYKGDYEKARKYFKIWELKGEDKLQPYLYRWFEILLFKKNLAEVYDFYREVENCPLRHTVYLIKSELIKRFSRLIFVLDEETVERDYSIVRHFNDEFASTFREAIVRKKKARFDSNLFAILNQVFEHSVKGEVFTLRKVLEELAKWLGLNRIEIIPYQEDLEKEWLFVLADRGKQVCLISDTEVDDEFFPLLKFVLEIIATHVKFIYTGQDTSSYSYRCDFLNEIIGKSDVIKKLKESILKVADFNVPVLIVGESGTGKELVARALHYCSKRRRNRFIPINCAAIPANLLESELFGYEKGAFSGAVSSKKGLLEVAGDGTVFLDEIGEMSPLLQAKLLRVLQEREFTPIGSTRVKKVNARFVFATNRDLKKLVKQGEFREDLYFRIAAYNIQTPTLNDRREDIPLLAEYFLRTNEAGRDKSFSYNVLQVLKNYQYKGNVRELQNIITGALILSGDNPVIDVEHLPEYVRPSEISFKGKLKEAEEEFRRKFIKSTIERCNGNLTKAARELGITRQRLHQLLKKLGIEND
ncbi:hypothetical protein TTHT_1972 [Thermotomaculum hydrothermale]|uniref:Sigma-54 factor interaction domain-containing protein n=1 Tax=Thermotomaculum hydrothermale TaxID=981385 RepID=A0A7R6PS94_9BACT|nr:sigma-54 dependent transcriptional regulator [Thermotomaculum hydrothermale]BBB33416.1 hypothetical protein TTHT_1972 [Thermotomaculum hydrothermale]